MGRYKEIFAKSIENRDAFWSKAAEGIDWYRTWDRVLDQTRPPFYRWFAGGELNTCYNALDRHVERGRADQVALIYDSQVTNTIEKFTYRELLDLVVNFAGVDQDPEELRDDLVRMVRNQIGPIACYRETAIVKRLPKTRSGKILRGTMRAIASGREYRLPSTIDDPIILDEITETLAEMGYPKK